MKDLKEILRSNFLVSKKILKNKKIGKNELKGYWSNISKTDQDQFLKDCKTLGTLEAVKKSFPDYEDIIFDPSRVAALKFLDIKDTDLGVDYGCMWGNVLTYCAKQSKFMVGIDQTFESLEFLNQRIKEENLTNVALINENLRNELPFNKNFDFSIVNGVLEWIPDTNQIELKKHFNEKTKKSLYKENKPRDHQLKFLTEVNKHLKEDGKLYLAIENRWDYQHFLWKRDPHSNLFYTAILPRKIANFISKIVYGRSYVNYIYSINGLKKLLNESGFKISKKFAVFPDYRFPQIMIDMENPNTADYRSVYINKETKNIAKKLFRIFRKLTDILIYQKLKLLSLSPSIIIIAKKIK